jgi:hypothetical protein
MAIFRITIVILLKFCVIFITVDRPTRKSKSWSNNSATKLKAVEFSKPTWRLVLVDCWRSFDGCRRTKYKLSLIIPSHKSVQCTFLHSSSRATHKSNWARSRLIADIFEVQHVWQSGFNFIPRVYCTKYYKEIGRSRGGGKRLEPEWKKVQ